MRKQGTVLTREALYDLVWTFPRTTLAQRFELSDVAIAKQCKKAGIPMPPLGYWSKIKAGKTPVKSHLPPKQPGLDNTLVLGGGGYQEHQYLTDEALMSFTPQAPVFDEPLDEVFHRIQQGIGKMKITRTLKDAHHLIKQIVEQHEQRYSGYGFVDKSYFDPRRLRLLSGLFKALSRWGAKPRIGNDAQNISIQVADTQVNVSLEAVKSHKKRNRNTTCVNF